MLLFRLAFLSLSLSSSFALGASGITYHGRIVKPDGQPLESPATRFRIRIKAPDAGNCILWEEEQTRNMSNSSGAFSLTIGDSTDTTISYTRIDTYAWSMERVFSNRLQFSGLTGCAVGNDYIPNAADGRILEVSFKELATDPTWEAFPATKVNMIPMAFNTLQLEGYRANEFLKIDPFVNQTPISNAGVNTLLGLIAGTSNLYVKPADPLGGDLTGTIGAGTVVGLRGRAIGAAVPMVGQVLKFDGTSWVPSADDTGGAPADASYAAKGVVQFDTSAAVSGISVTAGVARLADTIAAAGPVGASSTIPVITYDAKGRLTTVATATVDDATKLRLAGGTMTGSINMGLQNITNATSVAATNFSGRNLLLSDNDTNVATIRAPVNLVADYALTLPTAAPTNGYVLSTDATGQLSWIPAATGSVTSVTATAPVLSTGGATPVISLDTGLTANKVPQVGGTALGANGVVVANGTATALTSLNCAVNQVIKFDASGFAVCGTDDAGAANAFVQNGNAFGAAAVLGTNDNNSLSFETNSTTRMTILANGNVGIGTGAPTETFHSVSAQNAIYGRTSSALNGEAGVFGYASGFGSGVIGRSVNGVGVVAQSDSGASVNPAILATSFGSGAGVEAISWDGSAGFFRSGDAANTSPTVVVRQTGAGAADLLQVQNAANTSLVKITSSGNVGIGTTLPEAPLHVEPVTGSLTDGYAQYVRHNFDRTDYFELVRNNLEVTTASNYATRKVGTSSNVDNVSAGNQTAEYTAAIDAFASKTGAGSALNVIGVRAGGASNATVTNLYGIKSTAQTTGGSATATNANGGHFEVLQSFGGVNLNGYGVYVGNVQATNKWSIFASDTTAPSYFAGSVGIGTTTPATKLDVSGAVRIGNDATACAAGLSGSLRYNGGVVEYCNGTAWQAFGVSGAGLTSLNGQTGNTQTFNVTATGLTPAINSGANVHTLSIPLASGAGVTSGTISKVDYDNFSGKLTSPLTTKGDLLVQNATVPARLPVGTNGQILAANSATATGLEWIAAPTGDITSVVAGAGLIDGGLTGDVTLNVAAGNGILVAADSVAVDTGLGANKVPQVGGTALGANGVVVANGTATALTSLNCAVNQVIKFDASGFATCGTDDSGAVNAFVQNGNAFGAAAVLGTNDAQSLILETNNTLRMIMTSTGTTGFSSANQAINTGTSNVAIFSSDAQAADVGGSLGFGGQDGSVIDRTFARISGRKANSTSGNYDGYLSFETRTNGSLPQERMRINQQGNVGIGTTNPTTTLDVIGVTSLRGGFNFVGSSTMFGGQGAFLQAGPSNSTDGTGASLILNGASDFVDAGSNDRSNGGDIVLVPGSKSTSGGATERDGFVLLAPTSGFVGIGTTSPNTILDVNGAISQRGIAAIAVSPAGQGRIYFDSASNRFRVSQNGGAYTDLIPSTGAGDISNGGNSFGAAATIGTNDNFGLNFETNSLARMTIRNDGNVGIGETNPTTPFVVRRDINGENILTLSNQSTPGFGVGSRIDFAGQNGVAASFRAGEVDSLSGTLDIGIKRNGNYEPGIQLEPYGTRPIVNIGTGPAIAEPPSWGSGRLNIHFPSVFTSDSDTLLMLDRSVNNPDTAIDGYGSRIVFRFETDENGYFGNYGAIETVAEDVSRNSKDGSLRFYTLGPNAGNSVLDPTEKLRIDSSGNVGMGTTTPSSRLDINGATTIREMAAPAVSPADQGRIYFDSTSNKFRVSENGGAYVDLIPVGGTGDILNGGNSTGAAVTIGTNDNFALNFETNGITKMSILNNGRVGFGTATPGGIFEVFPANSGNNVDGLGINLVAQSGSTGIADGGHVAIVPGFPASGGGETGTVLVGDASGIVSVAISSPGSTTIKGINSASASLVVQGSGGNISGELVRFENRNGAYLGHVDVNGNLLMDGFISSGTPIAQAPIHGNARSTTGNSVAESLRVSHEDTNSGGASGIGAYLSFSLETTTNDTFTDASRIESVLDDATNNSKDGSLRFYTIGPNASSGTTVPTEKLRINSSGNVGIGTISPAEKLSVVTGLAGQGMSLRSGAAGNRTWMSVGRTSDELQLGVTGAANEFYNGSAAGTSVIRANSTNKIMLGTNGTVPEITLEPGLVGIGTIYPQTNLDLQGSMQFRGISSETIPPTADHGRIYYDLEDKKFKVSENGAAYTDLVGGGGGGITGLTAGRVTYAASATTITDSANLTFDPATGLFVNSTNNGSISINGSAVSEGLNLTNMNTSGYSIVGSGASLEFQIDSDNNSTNQYFSFTNNGSTELVRIAESGNVGIGTNSPTSRLDVSAGANVTAIQSTGYSLTGANSQPLLNLTGTWNTTGAPTLIQANVVDTASGGTPNLIDLQVNSSSMFRVSKYGMLYSEGVASYSEVYAEDGFVSQNGLYASNTGINMTFKANNGSGATAMTILNSNSNVGIGTTNPTSKLEVNGSVRTVAGAVTSALGTDTDLNIDFSTANVITTSASCNSTTLSNMQDGGSYTLIVTGTSSGTCTFTHAGVSSFKFAPANGATDVAAGGETVYTFLKAGSKVYVSWITGMR